MSWMAHKFTGKDYSQDELSPEDRARLRHAINELEERWELIDELITTLQGFFYMSQGIKIGGPILLAAAALGAFASLNGWLG